MKLTSGKVVAEFGEAVTELRMLLAEWLILLACYVMSPKSPDTAIWCTHLKAANEEIAISLDCEVAGEERP